jgi:hypothetical protein
MGMMLDEFELDYRKREIRRYEDMLDDGKTMIDVPIQSVVKMLAENLSFRGRVDYLMEQILRHDFTIPQRILMPNDVLIRPETPPEPPKPAAPKH